MGLVALITGKFYDSYVTIIGFIFNGHHVGVTTLSKSQLGTSIGDSELFFITAQYAFIEPQIQNGQLLQPVIILVVILCLFEVRLQGLLNIALAQGLIRAEVAVKKNSIFFR